ncbi:MAG: SusC/RagA family TonB-linked outer membrane protein [Prolixibacteraceae bacterium]|jgi:hypothetical protein
MSFASVTYSQATRLTFESKNATIEDVFKQIESISDFKFAYNSTKLDVDKKISIKVDNQPINVVLDKILGSAHFNYQIVDRYIIITDEKSTTSFKQEAQQLPKKVTGKVTDFSGSPIPGVSVAIKGTGNGSITDRDGNYSISNVPENATLQFSFVGMKSQEILIAGRTLVNVTMADETIGVDEVVVVGYGVQKKVNLTGAVSQISSEDLKDRPVSNMSQILQGSIPNLNVTFSTGQPGAGGSLNVRGTTSINGGGPLVLIDGVPGDINRINPYDVESVTVLKDAAASAIYGARGAFGVVLVTTKNAKEGKMTISYNTNFGWASPTVSTDFLTNGYESVKLNDEAFLRSTGNTYTRYSEEDYAELEARRYDKTENPDRPWIVVKNVKGKDIYNYYGNYDWWNAVFSDVQASQQHNVNVSGGNTKINYLLSGSYYEKDGIMKINPDKFDSYTFRSKINAQILPWLKISNNTQYYNSGYKYQGKEGGGNPNFVSVTVHALPAYAPVNPDGSPTYNTLKNNYSIGDGIYALLLDGKAGGKNTTHEVVTTSSMVIDVNKNLKIMGDYSFTLYLTDNWYRSTVTKYSVQPGIMQEVPNFNSDQLKQTRILKPMKVANLYANYNQDFGKHHIAGTTGVNYEYTNYSRLYGARKNLLSETLNDLNLGTGDQETGGGAYEYTLFGAFFRGNYDYAGKYLFEVNGRYDGTSRFGEGQRFGFFPSISFGYRISEESFFEPIKEVINNLKFRYSYGTLGNQLPSSTSSGNFYPYISLMPTTLSSWISNSQKIQYVSNPRPISPELTWERSKTSNIGLDADFLKSRLTLSVDAYIRKTIDMLVPGKVLPAVFGATVPTENAGDLETKGFEISLAWRDEFNLRQKPFSYNISIGVSDYTSTITKYDNPTNLLSNYYVGEKLGEIWGYSLDGFFKTDEEAQNFTIDQSLVNRQRINSPGIWSKLQAGDIKFIDLDGDKKITPGKNTLDDPGDRRIIGNKTPRYRFGVNIGFNWNNFDFSTLVQGIGHRDWYPGNNADKFWGPYSRPYYSFIPRNFEKDVWTPENPDAYFPVLRGYTALNSSNDLYNANDRYLQNAGYIRLKNLVVGYTLPQKWTSRINIEKLRVYLSGENLGYYTPMRTKYIDPEQLDGDGTNGRTYPMSKTLSFGVDLSF